jgi:uncharacterized protein YceH (UPF0502 family)
MFDTQLNLVEQRVLGCLLEKQLSTPDTYPLSLNALVNACNQSSNRDPVLALDEQTVLAALSRLRDQQATWSMGGGRVPKYGHKLTETFALSIQEGAILAELLLRGPQTPGELRTRCTRMYSFPDLAELESVLALLVEAGTLVVPLPRQPGTKEIRYAHRLGALPEAHVGVPAGALAEPPAPRPAPWEQEVAGLREELAQLRAEFEAFRRQFD